MEADFQLATDPISGKGNGGGSRHMCGPETLCGDLPNKPLSPSKRTSSTSKKVPRKYCLSKFEGKTAKIIREYEKLAFYNSVRKVLRVPEAYHHSSRDRVGEDNERGGRGRGCYKLMSSPNHSSLLI